MIPFTKLAERYPSASHSARVHQILEILHLQSQDLNEGANILRRIHTYFHAELDVISKKWGFYQKTPIILTDFSQNYFALLSFIGQRSGLNENEAWHFSHHVGEWRNNSVLNERRLGEWLPAEPFQEEYTRQNVVRITNLDETLSENPHYLPLVLFGVYDYLNYRYQELGAHNSEEILRYFDTKIALQTRNPTTAFHLKKLGGEIKSPQWTGNDFIFTTFFNLNAIKALQKEFPAESEAASDSVSQGFWFFTRIGEHPLKF